MPCSTTASVAAPVTVTVAFEAVPVVTFSGKHKTLLDELNYLRMENAYLKKLGEFDPKYSAAWKLLGKAQAGSGDVAAARLAWEKGIEAAQAHGDKQAEKEMTVFLKKLDRQA